MRFDDAVLLHDLDGHGLASNHMFTEFDFGKATFTEGATEFVKTDTGGGAHVGRAAAKPKDPCRPQGDKKVAMPTTLSQ